MALRDTMEIYIPVQAEVKSIPLCSLPKSVLKQMGPSDSNGSSRPTDSPKGIWICPVVIRRKGQKLVTHTGKDVKENMFSQLVREPQIKSRSIRMSFVSSNHTAYKLLKETMPGNTVSKHTSDTSWLPQGSSPQTREDAIVIYNGQIYLSIRKPKRSQPQQEPCEPRPASQSPTLTTSRKSQKKELLNDNKSNSKATHGQNNKGATHTVRDVSSSTTARSVPQSTGSVHRVDGRCHEVARAEQTAAKAAVQDPDLVQCREEQEELADGSDTECDMQDLSSDMDGYTQIDCAVQSSAQSWTSRESLGAAGAPTPNEYDLLEAEEEYARKKAKFKASLDNANSLK